MCGRRWGKTATGLLAALQGHGAWRGHRRGALDGGSIWWVTPVLTTANEVIWPQVKAALRDCAPRVDEQGKRIELPNGGSISVKSTDRPDKLRGPGLDGLVMDEAAFMRQRVWTEICRAMLADKQGWVLFASTPNGLNWFSDLHRDAQTRPDWAAWRQPTHCNPRIAASELDAMRLDLGPRLYTQEVEAIPTEREGSEFPTDYLQDIWFDAWPPETELSWRVIALDPSKGRTDKSDYSAFVLLALHNSGRIYVDADLERRDIGRIAEDAVRLQRSFAPHAFGVEADQYGAVGHVLAEKAKAAGVDLPLWSIHNRENKRVRIRAGVTPYLSRGELRIKRGSRGARLLHEQLSAFPLDNHDDGPDALEMGLRLLRQVFEHGPEQLSDVTEEPI